MHQALLLSVALLGNMAQAQITTATIADCENRHVLLGEPGSRGERRVAVVYVEPSTGFNLRYETRVTIDGKGSLRRIPDPHEAQARVSVRVEENRPIDCLDTTQAAAIGLDPPTPAADPRPPAVRARSWGGHYLRIGAYAQALRFLEEARALGEHSPELAFDFGLAFNALGRHEEARMMLTPAVERAPEHSGLVGELALAEAASGQLESARKLYERAIILDGGDHRGRRAEYARKLAALEDARGQGAAAAAWRAKADRWKVEALHEREQQRNAEGTR